MQQAQFIACHQFQFVERLGMLDEATDGAVFLINSPFGPGDVWDELPRTMQEELIRKHIRLYVIDADRVAIEAGMASRINTIMQTCFFAILGVLPRDEAIDRSKMPSGRPTPAKERNSSRAISRLSIARFRICMKSCCRPRQRARASQSPSCPRTRPISSGG